ncbi:DNA polymerase zeta catalytic subunit isoform X1 [Rousettus aegyptiacus]|uniref:DNA polymerase zeta catalytic subunit n=3 Tax=Rousettus aegyptiacus TaxID=9407 RepID=A0A7J8KFK8_ROUAE|nr:DNA polymerase zeta catalytic subunit isoform X1 [Rousettus aegyptiacus]KAF6507624.1 REV3 like, DNA directed polymerase zeta catalytic subunit [Rousettus aegyptiacus]
MFSVRIVTADYYMASPLQGLDICQSPLTQAPVKKVPVVRVFGATPAGQKTCLHLHGIFPYLYVPYDGYGQQPESYLSQMAFSIDRALNVALGSPSSTAQHVFKVSLVSGMPFYGYHEKERHFMKIYLYNPAMVKRICELLQSGAIMNKFYQPHEAHIPYLLQLFIDYNLYGMNLINLAAVKFRKAKRKSDPLLATGSCKDQLPGNSLTGTLFRWEENEIPSSLILEDVKPQSTCELEVDAVAADILNRLDIETQIGGNPGLQAIWEDEKQRRRNRNETSQISQPESQDRKFVPATESEKKFQKKLQEILKQNDFSVTLSGSVDYNDGSQEFSAELTLHSEVLSPEILQCTPANMVEVHKDTELSKGHTRHKVEEALINEEAILNLMETSQTFQPLTQRLSESPVFLDSSPDEALVHLLAGLENDGYRGERNRMSSPCCSFGNTRNPQNSDDEENEPQIEKEEMELSLVMSQRWDSNIEERCAKKRSLCQATHRSSTEEDDSSSEEEMEWSNNSLLLANLSIPQLDGTADENSDNPLNNENSRTHSSVIATSKLSVKPSIFHKDAATLEPSSSAKITFQCKHTSALSSHVLNKEDLIEDLSQQNNVEKDRDHSVASFTNENTYSVKYPRSLSSTVHSENSHKESSKKDIPPVSSCESSIFDYEEDIPSVTRQVPSRKYTNIRKTDKEAPFIHMNRHTESTLSKNSFNFTDLSHSKNKSSSEGNEKGNSTALNSLFPSSLTENCELLSCSGENRTMVHSLDSIADESGLNKLKIRYEEFQEHKTEKPNLSQQAAHYMFFPSVVLSNCLSRPQKLSPVTYKLQPSNKQPRLKMNKKKLIGHQETSTKTSETGSTKDNCILNNPCNSNSEKNNVLASDLIKVTRGAFENKTPTDSFIDCHFGDGTLETEQSFGLYGNKYTLRAKRKVNYETEDSESSFVTHNSKISLPHPVEIGESLDGTLKSRKRRKMSKKLPPVIIKYIIINRFRGRKNMLVKLGKIDSKEKQVILTEEKLELYKKLAPLKDFWPKVPDSPATKYPIYPLTPKKSHRRKTKHKSAKKKTGKQQRANSENIKRTLSFRKKRSHAILSPPSPSYNAETEDCDLNYSDVMSKLGFLSERSTSPINSSPPRCWSPTDPRAEEIIAAANKEAMIFKGPNVYNSRTVNTRIEKNSRARAQVKKSKTKLVNPSVVTKKRNKRNQTSKLVDDGKKKPRAKQKQKNKKAPRKHITLKDEKIKSQSGTEVKFVLKHQNVSETSNSSGGSQLLFKQKDVSLMGSAIDHPLSAPQTAGIHAQQNLSGCFSSFLESKKPVDLQTFPSSRDDLHSSLVCNSLGPGISKVNVQRSHSQSALFTLKESTLIQKNIFDLSNHLSQVAQNKQISSGIMSPKTEENANIQKNYLSSIGKLNECRNSLESKPDPAYAPNVLHCKDSQQQIVCMAEQSKHSETCSPGNAASEESQMPNNCFVTSLRSPIKQIAWEQKQRGFILGMSNFKPERVKQRSLSEAISQTKALSQCKNQNVSTPSAFGEGQSGLAVLKELLQKRQQKAQNADIMQDPLSNKHQPNKNISVSHEHNKTVKRTRSVTSPRKPRTPRSTKPKEKIPKLLKVDSLNLQNSGQLENSLSDDSPIFFSDPGFESCYSLEDSLSPEHNYNFDINTIGQTGFCSFYSGSQFVPADQNLPQKFLSDAVQDLFPGQTIEKTEFLSHDNQKCDEDKHHASDSTSWIRSSTLSPELFEKSSIESNENHRHNQWKNSFHPLTTRSNSIIDSFCVQQAEDCLNEKSRLGRSSISKEVFFSLSQPSNSDWIQDHTREEMGQSLDSVNTSFTTILSSPDGELVDAASEDLELYVSRNNDILTPTPDSSPRSTSSPSQSKNGSFTPRTAHILKPLMSPPSREEIMATLLDHDLSETIYQEPFCSNPSDVPEKPREIGGRLLMVETRLPNDLAEFEGDFSLEGLRLWKTAFSAMTQNPRPGSPLRNGQGFVNKESSDSHKMVEDKKIVIMPCKCAPSRQLVQAWLQAKEEYVRSKKLSKTEPTGVVKSTKNFSASVNPYDKPVVPPKMDITPHILPTTAHTKEDVDNAQIALQVPAAECSQTTSESQMLPLVASANDPEKDEGDDDDCYVSYSSSDSPVIPPWQQPASPDSKTLNGDDIPSSVEELCSLTIENFLKPIKDNIQKSPCSEPQEPLVISPINVRARTGMCESLCLHSTPVIQRKLRERLPEATGFSPLSTEPKTQKLSHRKGSNTDTHHRRVLLTQAKNQFAAVNTPKKETSQIDGPSLNNTYGFKVSIQNLQEAKALHEIQNLTLISVELHARTRRDLEPDPEFDPICALFYCISSDTPLPDTDKTELTGVIVIDKDKTVSNQDTRYQTPLLIRSGITRLEVTYAADEKALFQEITDIIKRYDPDILLGYEIQMHSWGYLLQRAAALSVDLCHMISRVPDDKTENRFAAERDEYGSDTMSEINIVGRITLNLWRIMRNEVALTNYTFENVSFHVLHQRFPLFTFRVLSDWFDNKTDLYRWKMVDHYISRVRGNLQMLEQLDLIGKTSEMARLFGIQFLHVLTRGSQYRVESMMLRIAKPMNYIPVTPSVQQRSQMRAPQCVPLIMEPESRFYSNSVLVLDFQSLYPSIVIAYNYCFSTCLGHVENLGKYDEFKFGCTSLRVPPDLLYQIRHDITVSPNGIAFVKPSVRKGVLPRMLEEILKTRLMVKQSMKAYKQDRALSRMLDARQLGLKLIANVTFGYTAANFSGRMPCIEVGDSIVHKARETLERAIKLVNDTKKWGARVVYGDTDSMFVLLKGATKEQSFKIGQEIAEAVTATNPKPVKLKFEKVYLPCVLQTKKRYVGYMYETLDQKDPVFDAKGIETVRRDSCPAVSKILERSLKLLFETRDISLIKQYVQRQCMKLLEGKASIQDFIFAKEYRGSSSYKPGACVPALELTRKMLTYDRRSEPRVGERVPYVIIYGTPGVPLIQLVRRPVEVLQDPTLRLNATYYITKQILPPLARIFSLIGIDVFNWYHELPRIQKATSSSRSEPEGRKGTISQYFTTLHCPVCDDLTQHGICSKCRSQPQHVAVILNQEIRELERKQEQLTKICKNCTGCFDRHIPCVSLNCPVLFKLFRVNRELSKAPYLRQLLDQF